MLPYSELKNTQQEFWDEAAGNGMTKIFIGSSGTSNVLPVGSLLFIYRIHTLDEGSKAHKSCLTSFATITDMYMLNKWLCRRVL